MGLTARHASRQLTRHPRCLAQHLPPPPRSQSGKPAAVRVRPAPRGANAQLSRELSPEIFYGIVAETAQTGRAYGGPPASGLLEYVDSKGRRVRVPYQASATDQPRQPYRAGDQVCFRLATGASRGRRPPKVDRGSSLGIAAAEVAGKYAAEVRSVRSRVRLLALYDATGVCEVRWLRGVVCDHDI